MKKLLALITEMENYISSHEKTNPTVSNATVGWQIAHSLKVINTIIDALKLSNPTAYKWKFNKMRFVLMLIGKIPRGKAKAPKAVQPSEEITTESLKEQMEKVRSKLQNWNSIDKNAHFPHPYFGDLNKKTTIKFLGLHTNHHLKIIKDILKD